MYQPYRPVQRLCLAGSNRKLPCKWATRLRVRLTGDTGATSWSLPYMVPASNYIRSAKLLYHLNVTNRPHSCWFVCARLPVYALYQLSLSPVYVPVVPAIPVPLPVLQPDGAVGGELCFWILSVRCGSHPLYRSPACLTPPV